MNRMVEKLVQMNSKVMGEGSVDWNGDEQLE